MRRSLSGIKPKEMELKQLIEIFKTQKKAFYFTVFVVLIAAITFSLIRPVRYTAVLNLNVTRSGAQETANYKFDDFYRLQADERFADTIVRWLESPRVAVDILNDANFLTSGMTEWRLGRYFKAQRLSSQFVKVSFKVGSVESAKSISQSSVKILNQEAQKLNDQQDEKNWFVMVGSDPIVRQAGWSLPMVILISLLAGMFLGFWVVLIKNYLKN